MSLRKINCFLSSIALLLLGAWLQGVQAAGYPVAVSDSFGATVTFSREPRRVVSLVPSATEMLLALGRGETVAALTYHDAGLPGLADKPMVGGFLFPKPKGRGGGPAGSPDRRTASPDFERPFIR